MSKKIITISRQFGSGGRFIGEEIAKKLGLVYYDKVIIDRIAEESGLSPEFIRESAELSPKRGLFSYAFAGRDVTGKSIEDIVYEAQRKVILSIAEKEAVRMMQDVDKRRAANYTFYTGQKWGKASNYTLSLNSSQLGYEMCEKIIMDCMKGN